MGLRNTQSKAEIEKLFNGKAHRWQTKFCETQANRPDDGCRKHL